MWSLFFGGALWALGLESIYAHPTPLYAFLNPVFTSSTGFWFCITIFVAVFSLLSSTRRKGHRSVLTRGHVAALLALATALYFLIKGASPHAFSSELAEAVKPLALQAPAVFVFTTGFLALRRALSRVEWHTSAPSIRSEVIALAGLVIFLMAFSASVALFRGGLEGIARAYTREGYEYSHDLQRIFATDESWSIRRLFRDYINLQPQLSLHAKVHPPGAITLLWLLSYAVGTAPLGLSLATIAFGATAIVPLYYWVKDMASARAALICASLYALVPAIVIFTATSADILFTPLSLATLFLFWRAINGGAAAYGALAGIGYALMSLTSFTLISIGAFFGLVGLWFLWRPARRGAVFRTAFLMTTSLLLVHGAVWLWSGFDVITFFRTAKSLFDLDQMRLESLTPRFPSWAWLILNPAAWFFYAGLPLSVLCWWWLLGAGRERRGLRVVFGLTLIALNFLYLGRGEGERSALYIFPFIAVPAGLVLDDLCARAKTYAPVEATVVFLGIQCWFVECFFYTYW